MTTAEVDAAITFFFSVSFRKDHLANNQQNRPAPIKFIYLFTRIATKGVIVASAHTQNAYTAQFHRTQNDHR